jgi:hypothetical protein
LNFKEATIDRWVGCHFSDTDSSNRADAVAYQSKPSPTWLIASECPLFGSRLRRQLFACGCNVVGPCLDSVSIIRSVNIAAFDGAILSFDRDPEIVSLAMDVLCGRALPFLYCGDLKFVLPAPESQGAILKNSFAFSDFVGAIQRVAPRASMRMDFAEHLNLLEAEYVSNVPVEACPRCWFEANAEGRQIAACGCDKENQVWVPAERDIMLFSDTELANPDRLYQLAT